jgi:methylenetetrahydrofolate dehydrogenase (NADP+)/methenyltetrahydrofolate cyclohydrolase
MDYGELRNPADAARFADIIMAAVGAPHLLRGRWVEPGALVSVA